jgi:hypothetical protein
MSNQPNITELRAHLMGCLASLRDRDNPMEPDRAKAIAQVAGVLVETAKVENDYLRITGQDRAEFLETSCNSVPSIALKQGAHNPFPGVTRHRLEG